MRTPDVPSRPATAAGTEEAPAAAARRRRRAGKISLFVWLAASIVLTCAGVIGQSGPFAWMAALQQRLFGTDDVMVSTLPGIMMMLMPSLLNVVRRRDGQPFVAGLKDGVDALTTPPSVASLPDPRRTLLRRARIYMGCAVAGLVGGGIGFVTIVSTTGQHQGEPLPVVGEASAIAPHAILAAVCDVSGHSDMAAKGSCA